MTVDGLIDALLQVKKQGGGRREVFIETKEGIIQLSYGISVPIEPDDKLYVAAR